MNMGVQYTLDLPSVAACDVKVDLWIKRGIDYDSLIPIST